MNETDIRKKIHELVKEHVEETRENFVPGKTPILTGLAVYDENEINAMIDTILDGWFGLGKKGLQFENSFSNFLGNKSAILVNSGSSANLLGLNAIKIKQKLNRGEIITPACTFPTTLNPILQLGFRPALIDVDKTLNINPESVKNAITKDTKGIMFAHALGNPAQISEIMEIAEENDLFVLEDCCDAHGSKYDGRLCGTFGTASTFSFYPAHAMTLGEGGAVSTNDTKLYRILRSLRDWGRDCWCTTDNKNPDGACGKRFDYEINGIPYDHKYIYSQIGYNLKPLELQAAMGLVQLGKLDYFSKKRQKNFKIYSEEFVQFEDYVSLPEINKRANPVFFGLPIILNDSKIDRQSLIKFLNKNNICTRLLFSGNIIHQPAYKEIDFARYDDLVYSEKIIKDCFWIGVHPGINEEMIKFIISRFKEYFNK